MMFCGENGVFEARFLGGLEAEIRIVMFGFEIVGKFPVVRPPV
jgi:hypothetical protein